MRNLLAIVLLVGLAAPAWAVKDIVVTEADFTCMRSWTKIEGRKARLFNKRKRLLKKAIKVFTKAKPGKHFPPGTMVELIPPIRGGDGEHVFKGEVMVKHKKGFNPEGGDWEFFVIDWRDADGSTVIVKRGKAEVANIGPACQGCHAGAQQFDFICDNGRGRGGDCAPINIPGSVAAALQDRDPRCPAAQ